METGQKLPENLGFDQDGKEWKTSELAGKKVVLYILKILLQAAPIRLAACATIMSVLLHKAM